MLTFPFLYFILKICNILTSNMVFMNNPVAIRANRKQVLNCFFSYLLNSIFTVLEDWFNMMNFYAILSNS